jgi:hypothetical protein
MKIFLRHPFITICAGVFLYVLMVGGYFLMKEDAHLDTAVLTAFREAPLGGGYIHLYPDGELDCGSLLFRMSSYAKSKYRVHEDTIFFDSGKVTEYFPRGFFIVDGKTLETGPVRYNIAKNTLVEPKYANSIKKKKFPNYDSHYKYLVADLDKYKRMFGRFPEGFDDLIKMDSVDRRYYRNALHFTYVPINKGMSYKVNGINEKDIQTEYPDSELRYLKPASNTPTKPPKEN